MYCPLILVSVILRCGHALAQAFDPDVSPSSPSPIISNGRTVPQASSESTASDIDTNEIQCPENELKLCCKKLHPSIERTTPKTTKRCRHFASGEKHCDTEKSIYCCQSTDLSSSATLFFDAINCLKWDARAKAKASAARRRASGEFDRVPKVDPAVSKAKKEARVANQKQAVNAQARVQREIRDARRRAEDQALYYSPVLPGARDGRWDDYDCQGDRPDDELELVCCEPRKKISRNHWMCKKYDRHFKPCWKLDQLSCCAKTYQGRVGKIPDYLAALDYIAVAECESALTNSRRSRHPAKPQPGTTSKTRGTKKTTTGEKERVPAKSQGGRERGGEQVPPSGSWIPIPGVVNPLRDLVPDS